jgi:hypothetical protein
VAMKSTEQDQVKFPKRQIPNWYAEQRQKNFKQFVFKRKFIEFIMIHPWNDNVPSSIGIQWFSGIQTPSILFGYPDQSYWETHSVMFGKKRCGLIIRGKKMPFVNYETYVKWKRERQSAKN